jgi:hypothetical protein
MGKLEEALDNATSSGRTGRGLGATTGAGGGVHLQSNDPGASAEEQIAGTPTTLDEETSGETHTRGMPTSPERTSGIESAER